MKLPNVLFKAAALTSSIILVAGFVSYRAGAFDWLLQPTHQTDNTANRKSDASPLFPNSDLGLELFDPPWLSSTGETTQEPPTIIGGTKSASPSLFIRGITPRTRRSPFLPTTPAPPVLMVGSKSDAGLIKPLPAWAQEEETPYNRILLDLPWDWAIPQNENPPIPSPSSTSQSTSNSSNSLESWTAFPIPIQKVKKMRSADLVSGTKSAMFFTEQDFDLSLALFDAWFQHSKARYPTIELSPSKHPAQANPPSPIPAIKEAITPPLLPQAEKPSARSRHSGISLGRPDGP